MPRYRIVPERSRVWIEARSSLHPIDTETAGIEGWLDLVINDDGEVDVRVPAQGHLELPVRQLRSGNPLQDRELQRRIDARRHPTIDGDLTTMAATDTAGTYLITGALTFIGETRTYTDEMTLEHLDDGTICMEGRSTFDVRDFGMQPPRIL